MPNYNKAQGVADLLSQGDDAPTLSEAAKETRDASGKLEQEGHDDQMSEREDERADGDAEH